MLGNDFKTKAIHLHKFCLFPKTFLFVLSKATSPFSLILTNFNTYFSPRPFLWLSLHSSSTFTHENITKYITKTFNLLIFFMEQNFVLVYFWPFSCRPRGGVFDKKAVGLLFCLRPNTFFTNAFFA